VPVVGEEAVEKDPGLLDLIARPGEACWIVDPLDGTANFAAGRDRFAMIICLVHDTQAIAGWILDVPNGRLAVTHRGGGVTFDGKTVQGIPGTRPLNGFVGYKIARSLDEQLNPEQRSRLGSITTLRCAGAEYLEILAGRASFSLYRTTKPWDHAAGTLMMREAGGGAVQFGVKWGGVYGTGVALTYSFATDENAFRSGYGDGEPDALYPLLKAEKAAVRMALAEWAGAANITFIEVGDSKTSVGELRFAVTDNAGKEAAHGYLPDNSPEAGTSGSGTAPGTKISKRRSSRGHTTTSRRSTRSVMRSA